MRTLISTLILLLACSHLVSAQSVKIAPKKVIYKRHGKNVPEYRREIEIRYPVISGKISPVAKRNLSRGLDYWRGFKTTLKEELSGTWLSSLDYEVKYNKNYILDICLTIEGVGAYPDSSTAYLVFDLRTGKQLSYREVFSRDKMSDLLSMIRLKMRKEEDKAVAEIEGLKRELEIQREVYKDNPTAETLALDDLDGFTISDSGLTFLYNYQFPHVSKALQPPGEFKFTWKQLKPYIKPGGLLGQFVR